MMSAVCRSSGGSAQIESFGCERIKGDRMMRAWQEVVICTLVLGMASIAGVAQDENAVSADIGQKAVHVVIAQTTLDVALIVPQTGKSLPADGRWAVGRKRSEACPQTPDPCVDVFYNVADAGVSCQWTVLLTGDASSGQVLAENDAAAQYFIAHVGPSEAAALVATRSEAAYPPIARAAHMTGTITLRTVVGPDGIPVRVFAVSGPEMLKGAALEAAKRWRFKPDMVGERAVRFQLEMTFTFAGHSDSHLPVAMKP
jgi:TonB family protein